MSARVILGDGTLGLFEGDALDMIYEAEGITGLITEVTLKIQPDEELDILSLGCADAHDLQHLLEGIMDADLPIWSMHFINPRMAKMKNRAPLMTHHGHPIEERVLLPASYILTLAFRKRDAETVRTELAKRMQAATDTRTAHCEAELLSEKIAHHEWEHRFRIMTVKRLGPEPGPRRSGSDALRPGCNDGRGGRESRPTCRERGNAHPQRAERQTRSGYPGFHPRRSAQVYVQFRLPTLAHYRAYRREIRRAALRDRSLLYPDSSQNPGQEAT